MEIRRRVGQEKPARGRSFDDLVDEEGRLKDEKSAIAETTATEVNDGEEGLRKRNTESKAASLPPSVVNPFIDDTPIDLQSSQSSSPTENHPQQSHESTATPPASSPSALKYLPDQDRQSTSLLNTEEVSNHPSEQLLDLTPTTSRSSTRNDLSDLPDEALQPPSYWSVNEWAENTSSPFYSPPQSEGRGPALTTPNIHSGDSTYSNSRNGDEHASESDLDIVSNISYGTSTPGSWTDVGSVVSEYE